MSFIHMKSYKSITNHRIQKYKKLQNYKRFISQNSIQAFVLSATLAFSTTLVSSTLTASVILFLIGATF